MYRCHIRTRRTNPNEDASRHFLGIPDAPIEQLYGHLSDPALTPEEKQAAFSSWISGYYERDPALLAAFPTLTREQLVAGLQREQQTEPMPTLTRIPAEDLATLADPTAMSHSTLAFTPIVPTSRLDIP